MAEQNSFDIVSPEDIQNGEATDAYFLRTEDVLEAEDENPEVVAEIQEDVDYWHVFAGLKDVATLLEGKPIDVFARPEGSLFKQGPVLRIEGNYLDFCRFETSILGFLCKASAVASAGMRAKAAAEEVPVLSFGTRRQHPSTAAMIERSALVGGMDGISHVAGGKEIGAEAGGTMPHALVISLEGAERAWMAYDRAMDKDVPRIMICDTYSDEKTETIQAAQLLGNALDGVRLDTTSSRRGDFREIVREVRWELDSRGLEAVDIFLSGAMDAQSIDQLRNIADGFGVGGYVANARPVDFSLNIVEVNGKPAAKRGERGFAKQVYVSDGREYVVKEGEKRDGSPVLKPVIEDGEVVMNLDYENARERVLEALHRYDRDDVLPFQ